MNILDIPYLIEIFFAISALVFVVTLYAILPAIMFNKRTFFKPLFINSLWQRVFKKAVDGVESTSGHKKKEVKKLLYVFTNK